MDESPRIAEALDRYLPRATQDSTGDYDNGSTVKCEKCGHDIHISEFPFCPHGKGVSQAISDSIPGGIEIRNGLCNVDGSPRTYYSHSEIKKEANRRGWTNVVTHTPPPHSDKSKHTTRWS